MSAGLFACIASRLRVFFPDAAVNGRECECEGELGRHFAAVLYVLAKYVSNARRVAERRVLVNGRIGGIANKL